jgi:hypothetical protein
VARFQAAPKESHVLAIKRIFRYLKGTKEFGLWYPKGKDLSLSTVEAEYIAATTCCTQVLLMKQTLTDTQVEYDEPIPIYCDNTSAISISKNPSDALQD